MTEIEKQALALINEVRAEKGFRVDHEFSRRNSSCSEALCRIIERHEAFRRDVSECVVAAKAYYEVPLNDLSAFIITEPDPLVEALREAYGGAAPEFVGAFRKALDVRGLEIVEKKP